MKIIQTTLTAAVLTVSSMTLAHAQDTYISAYGGLSNLSGADLDGDVTTPAGTGSQSVGIDFDDGFALGVAIGRDFYKIGNTQIRGEIELSYNEGDADDVFFSGNGPAAEVNVGGDVSTARVFANIYADFETDSAFTPYVGAGIGYSRTDFDVSYGNGVALDDSSNNLSAQLILGASYKITDEVSLFGDIRYVRDFDAETDRFSGAGALTGVVEDDLSSTNLNVGIAYTF